MPQAPDDDIIEKRAANKDESLNNNVSVTLGGSVNWEMAKMFQALTKSKTLQRCCSQITDLHDGAISYRCGCSVNSFSRA